MARDFGVTEIWVQVPSLPLLYDLEWIFLIYKMGLVMVISLYGYYEDLWDLVYKTLSHGLIYITA